MIQMICDSNYIEKIKFYVGDMAILRLVQLIL